MTSNIAIAFEEASLREVHLMAVHTWIDYSPDHAHQFLIDLDEVEAEEQSYLRNGWPVGGRNTQTSVPNGTSTR
ncbi:MAG: hypothetical protein ACRDTH_27540 [Pseudonocardiaceae bacterium]